METSALPSTSWAATAADAPRVVSAISWKAILAGSVAAVAITVVLLTLGSGLGFASVSPWANAGMAGSTVGALAAIWFVVVQWLSAGVGAYLTGRLRTRWADTHVHEVFFRDTAHGFVTWATATLLITVVLASVALGAASTGTRAVATVGAAMGAGAAQGAAASPGGASPYEMDTLFRPAQAGANTSDADSRAEAARILAKGVTDGDVSADDRAYLSTLVAAKTGTSPDDAQKRVDKVIAASRDAATKAKAAADAARKAAALASLLTAMSMLIGAFIACAAAALGGHERDLHA